MLQIESRAKQQILKRLPVWETWGGGGGGGRLLTLLRFPSNCTGTLEVQMAALKSLEKISGND